MRWCDGKDVCHKWKTTDNTDAEKPSVKRSAPASNQHEEMLKIWQRLGNKHGDKYAQYKLWASMIINKQHHDENTPPNIPMIMGKPDNKKPSAKNEFSDCLADCAVAIVKALKEPKTDCPQSRESSADDVISPINKVNICSQYLSQLKTLQNLCDDGVLTQEEFQEEKMVVLNNLKALKVNLTQCMH